MKSFCPKLGVAIAITFAAGFTGCSSLGSIPNNEAKQDMAPTTEAQIVEPATKIQDVFEKIGCKEGDILGTDAKTAIPGDFDYNPELVMTGTCRPVKDDRTVNFFEYRSAQDAILASTNGSIEAYPGELFIDGAVLVWAVTTETQSVVGGVAEAAN